MLLHLNVWPPSHKRQRGVSRLQHEQTVVDAQGTRTEAPTIGRVCVPRGKTRTMASRSALLCGMTLLVLTMLVAGTVPTAAIRLGSESLSTGETHLSAWSD